jgi:serine protease AprX
MRTVRFVALTLVLFITICSKFVSAQTTPAFNQVRQEKIYYVWVYFKDKGSDTLDMDLKAAISARSFMRHIKANPKNPVDFTDLPVYKPYSDSVAAHVSKIRFPSRWLNAVSVMATKNELETISKMPFVKAIDLEERYEQSAINSFGKPYGFTQDSNPKSFYGRSTTQLALMHVPEVHAAGNNGQGILIGIFDDGVRLMHHEAFDSTKIVATYDFVEGKESVVPTDSSAGAHGTMTLSVIGGYKPNDLVGPAYGASYVLARTEDDASETPREEDNFVRALEWSDSIGVDIVSASLGYLGYEAPFKTHAWEDMTGHTTLITRAANMAVAKGILVVVAAGNNGNWETDRKNEPVRDTLGRGIRATHNTLGAPADGDSVLSVGAVDSVGNRVYFSSIGPLNSNLAKIKPDVMAMGSQVYMANPGDPRKYTYADGTSFACPLTAGVGALILHAVPDATPLEIIEALKMTANNAAHPDNLNGWGLINVKAAIGYLRAKKVNN